MGKIKDAVAKLKVMATGNEPTPAKPAAPKKAKKVTTEKKLQGKSGLERSLPTNATTKKSVKRGKKYSEAKKNTDILESRNGTYRVTKAGKVNTFKTKKAAQEFLKAK